MQKKRIPLTAKKILESKLFQDMLESKKHIKFEFQDYGVRLSYKLNDPGHKSLYIRLAKIEDRNILESAYRFAVDYPGMANKNRGRLFMWKLKDLKIGKNK